DSSHHPNDSTRFRKACIFTTQKTLRENTCTIASGDYSTPVSQHPLSMGKRPFGILGRMSARVVCRRSVDQK
ncbi:MAG: hypothetical protein WC856_28395, partial [Methylococcaceae bacterium]